MKIYYDLCYHPKSTQQGFIMIFIMIYLMILSIFVFTHYLQTNMQYKMLALFKNNEIAYQKALHQLKLVEAHKPYETFSNTVKIEQIYKKPCIALINDEKGTIIIEKITLFNSDNLFKNTIVLQADWVKLIPDTQTCIIREKIPFFLGQQSLTQLDAQSSQQLENTEK